MVLMLDWKKYINIWAQNIYENNIAITWTRSYIIQAVV